MLTSVILGYMKAARKSTSTADLISRKHLQKETDTFTNAQK